MGDCEKMMRVYLGPNNNKIAGGINRVLDGLYTYLPQKGIEIVDDKRNADVYHAQISPFESVSPNIPLVVSSHGMHWMEVWGASSWSVNYNLIEGYRLADVVTTPSQFVADAIARNMLIKPLVVHHGINSKEWTPGENEGYVLWNKARIDPANDPAELNQLAIMAPDTKFVTTFGDAYDNVNVIGLQSPQDMLQFVQKCGVYLDTPRESGGPCFGILEAMSCAKPVLAWNMGGNAEAIVHKETGYLARHGDYQDLLAGLFYCQENYERLGENARQLVLDNYQWSDVIEGYIKAYHQALDKCKHTTKVSVIIPCFKLAAYLGSCLESVQQQSFQDWEAIVIDDASPDNTQEVIQPYLKDPRIKLITNPINLHVSETRNMGILASQGQYILPLDADDRLAPEALQMMVDTLEKDRSINIVSGILYLFRDGDWDNYASNGWPNNADYELQITGYNRLPYASMFRKKVWEQVGGYRRRIRIGIEDGDFWTRALSYGHKAIILEKPTLLYTLRENSLRNANPDGVDAWLSWFPWSKKSELTPFGATGVGPYAVRDMQSQVSVIIPVGPNHEPYIQGCVDSLIAQAYTDWEAVIVNDTGKRWFDDEGNPLNHYVLGMPFATFVDSDANHGVAYARNRGIEKAKASRIVFLDVDDILQTDALGALIKAQDLSGGWIYGDWYSVSEGKPLAYNESKHWSPDDLLTKAFGPITGIYYKDDIIEAGGFDESLPGWEDWDFHLNLMEIGVGGTRLKYPLIVYNMDYGQRREDNLAKATTLLPIIEKKHKQLYQWRSEGIMAKQCCGRGGRATVYVDANTPGKAATGSIQGIPNAQIVFEYIGLMENNFRYNSQVVKGHAYRIKGPGSRILVYPGDADFFRSFKKDFKEIGPYAKAEVAKPDIVLTSQTPPIQNVLPPQPVFSNLPTRNTTHPIDDLSLPTNVKTVIKRSLTTIEQLMEASDAQLLAIKGISDARVTLIRKAVEEWKTTFGLS